MKLRRSYFPICALLIACALGPPGATPASGIAITQPINAQTGTSYAIASTDAGKLITFSNASAVAVTLSQATTAGFTAGFSFDVQNKAAGPVTIMPTVSSINGVATLTIAQNTGCTVTSDGTNYQVSACTAAGAAFPALSGDVATTAGSNVTTIQPGAVTPAKEANYAANSIRGKAGAAGVGQDLNPLAAANLMSAAISVEVVATTNITLSGVQTIDGTPLSNGQSVLAANETSSVNDGIYIVNTGGAWTRATNFPNGYVIAQNCDLVVVVRQGTANAGAIYNLNTVSSSTTIGTSNQGWNRNVGQSSPTNFGLVKTTSSLSIPVASYSFQNPPAFNDCISTLDASGIITDQGGFDGISGPCIIADPNGHPLLPSTAPTVTGTGCSLAAGANTDNAGAIVATGADTCTLAFARAFTNVPHCAVGNQGATVLANLTALATTSHAVFATAAAGTFNYLCF